MLTEGQKDKIERLRLAGWKYGDIADELDISVNTIKSYCRRHRVAAYRDGCACCGKPLVCIPGKKKKRFCDDVCRRRYWTEHRNEIGTCKKFICCNCGKEFKAYGKRKYCSEKCYFEKRFGA